MGPVSSGEPFINILQLENEDSYPSMTPNNNYRYA